MVVTEAGGALRLAYGPNFASALEHWNGDNFRAKYDSPVLPAFFVSFRVTPTGTVSELVADMAGTPATFTRAAPPAGAAPPR
jgi:hypothetical protein